MKTIKDLKEAIKDLPDDLEIGGTGHYGEILECRSLGVETIFRDCFSQNRTVKIFHIDIEYAGDEPD